jgi:single-strand DNA-binding protein
MYNKIILVGNLTRDIEIRYSQNGNAIANTAIATSRKFTVNGEKREEVCFVDITFFGRSAEVANQYLRKGSKILVEGRLSFEQWIDQTSGQKRSKHSVIVETMKMLDRRDNDNGENNSGGYANGSDESNRGANAPVEYQQRPMPQNLPEIDINESEIPF